MRQKLEQPFVRHYEHVLALLTVGILRTIYCCDFILCSLEEAATVVVVGLQWGKGCFYRAPQVLHSRCHQYVL